MAHMRCTKFVTIWAFSNFWSILPHSSFNDNTWWQTKHSRYVHWWYSLCNI